MRKKIIFETKNGAQTDMEFEYWDKVLLKNLEKEYVFDDRKYVQLSDDAAIVYSCDRVFIDKEFSNALASVKNYSLIHLSNESMNHATSYYKKAVSVIRSTGWSPNKVRKNVFFVPVGYMSGYGNFSTENIPVENRKLIWSFAGAIKADRQAMLDAFVDITPNFHFSSQGWGNGSSNTQKTKPELIEIYKNTIFAPSPLGNHNFECFRTMEVLEYGCIPIIPKFLGYDPYKYLFGDHPLIIVDDWEEAASIVKRYLSNPDALTQKQIEVWNWYQAFKKQLGNDVSHILNGEFDLVKGKQFQYQKEVHKDYALRWKYFKHFALNIYIKRFLGKTVKSNNI